MEQKGLRTGHFLGLLGAAAVLASLWRPWYRVELPPQLRELLSSEGARSGGALGQFVRGLAAGLPSSVTVTGWESLKGADVALCLGAVAVVVLVIGAAGAFGTAIRVDPQAAGRTIALVSAAGLVVAIVHALHRPLSSEYVHPAPGVWLALAGCAAGLVGGLLATAPAGPRTTATTTQPFPRLEPDLPEAFAPVGGGASVPPPR
jgi:hypothetical protein